MHARSNPFLALTFILPLGLSIISSNAVAQKKFWEEKGLPVCTEAGWQRNPRLCTDGAQGAVIVWEDTRTGSTTDLYAQRVDSSGVVLWDTTGVPICTAAGYQYISAVISDERGGAIVIWADRRGSGYDIYAQRIGPDGIPLWDADGVPVCTASGDQVPVKAIPDGAGGAYLCWQDKRGANSDIYAQRIGSDGTSLWQTDGIVVCDEVNDQAFPEIVSDAAGGCIIVWSDKRTEEDLYAQRLSPAGVRLWTSSGAIVTTEAGKQLGARVAEHGDGGACVVWQDLRSGTTTDVYYQVLDKDGNRKFQNTTEPLSRSPQSQTGLSIIPDGLNGVISIWTDYKGAQNTGDIFVGRISETGELQWTPFSGSGLAMCTAADVQDLAILISDGAGGAVAVWQDRRNTYDYDLYMNRIDATGKSSFPGWSQNGTLLVAEDHNQLGAQIIPSGRGGAIVTWYDGRIQDGVSDIYAQKIGFSPWFSTNRDSLDFGTVKVRENVTRSFTIRNEGIMPMEIFNLRVVKIDPSDRSLAERDYSIKTPVGFPLTLDRGDSATFEIEFDTDSASTRVARIQIIHSAPGSPFYLILKGTGTEPKITLAGSQVTYGIVKVGGMRDSTLTDWITNPGNGTLTITYFGLEGGDKDQYEIINPPAIPLPVTPGGSYTPVIRFKPGSDGYKTTRLIIGNDASATPMQISLSGSGGMPSYEYRPFALNWDTVGIGGFEGKVFEIINSGLVDLELFEMKISTRDSTDFRITYYYPHTIAVRDTYGVWINFEPTEMRERRSTLMIHTDAPNSPEEIQMKGYGGILNDIGSPDVPADFILRQNRPNPFSGTTLIELEFPAGPVETRETPSLKIYDLFGREVLDLTLELTELASVGRVVLEVKGARLPGKGVYFYRLSSAGRRLTRKMLFVK